MDFRLLGPFEVVDDGGTALPIGGRRQRAVLAILAGHVGEVVSIDRLVDDLWGDDPPRAAVPTVQAYVSRLRRVLGAAASAPGGDVLVSRDPGYVLAVDRRSVDVVRFEELVGRGGAALSAGSPRQAARALEEALSLWRGPAFGEFAYEPFAVLRAPQLEERRLAALELRIDADLALQRHGALVAELEGLVVEHPLRERFWAQLMLALYRSGRQADALGAYRRVRSRLVEELGIEPGPELRELEQLVLAQSADLLPAESAEATAAARPPVAPAEPAGEGHVSSAPVGIVTLLFTDIEGSTRMWEESPSAMSDALARHDAVLRHVLAAHHGYVFKTMGDSFCAAFTRVGEAVRASVALQQALAGEPWPAGCEIKVRVALHTGECDQRDDDYFGPAVNRVARLVSSAHGGQTLLSHVTADLVGASMPAEATLEDLGILRLKDLGQPEHVYGVRIGDLPGDFPPLGPVDRGFDEVPAELTTLVGRESLVDEIVKDIGHQRSVTLTGPGGVGKTRVAIRAANSLPEAFEDGVRFVDVAVLPEHGSVADLLLASLHGAPVRGETSLDAVLRILGPSRLVLVIDNCEHQLDQLRPIVTAVLQRCPWVHVLATSRHPLGVDGECCVDVPGLELPPQGAGDLFAMQASPAARLFEMHARMVDSHFSLGPANVGAVAEICRRVGGLPLAIELAARQLDIVTIGELAQEAAGEQLLGRLASDSRQEHRLGSVAASLEWSLSLLSELERRLFASTAVFAGSFTREQAVGLIGERSSRELARAFDRIARLSLVTRDAPVRRSLEQRHAELMRDAAEGWEPVLRTHREAEACAELSAEFPDHRQAVAWCLEHSVEDAARLVVALFQFCQFQMRSEANEWAIRLTGLLDDDSPMAASVSGAAALGSWFEGDVDGAIRHGERSVRTAAGRADPGTLWAHVALMDAKGYSGRLEETVTHFKALASYGRESGDLFWQINTLGFLIIGRLLAGDLDGAMRQAEQTVNLARELGNPDCTHWAMHCLGRVLTPSDPDAACVAFEEAMEAAGSVGSRWNLSLDLLEWASLKRRLEEVPMAAQGLLELLELLLASGNRSQRSQFYFETARLLEMRDRLEDAYTVITARAGMPAMPSPGDEPDEAVVARLGEGLGRRAGALRVKALMLPENDLVVLCRGRLEDLVERERHASGQAVRPAHLETASTGGG